MKPEDVDVIVFWTAEPGAVAAPPEGAARSAGAALLFPVHRVVNNPRALDVKGPVLDFALETFKEAFRAN